MRLIFGLTILASLLAAGPAAAFDKAQASDVMANAVDGYIRPAYADFHAKASTLATTTAQFCAAASDEGLKAVQESFADTVESWGRIEFLRLGPVMEQNRLERIKLIFGAALHASRLVADTAEPAKATQLQA